ncbi:hypothetical protein FRC06_008699 [Ceratobasidium sp. 370]|nr:hypothetical protein FRC06_008699 [Ceratobasidium sp. 370]
MRSKPSFVEHILVLLLFAASLDSIRAALVDLTSANRRARVPGLPDWSKAGFEGGKALPDDSKVAYTLSAAELASTYGLRPNDGQDDTAALQNAIKAVNSQTVPNGSYRLIQLPAGTINLSWMIYVDTSYLIIRGAGSDPNTGTKIVFRPDADTKYDTITNERWDLDGMTYSWDFVDETANGPGPRVRGTATGGWLWPGRSIFRVGSSKVAPKYTRQFAEAPRNRKELFMGSVNYHWRSDEGTTKGWMVSQAKDKGGFLGSSIVHVNVTNTTWVTLDDLASTDVWIASPAKKNDFLSWGVVTEDWFVNSYIYQVNAATYLIWDWFTLTQRGSDADGPYFKLDRPLRFDVYRSSIGDGSVPMEDTETFAKAMPISHVVHHVGIENLYITHEIDGLTPESAQRNYGNLAPEQSIHGIVFRFARDCWVRGIRTFMTGSHPIATEAARNIQIQDNYFDGSWNKVGMVTYEVPVSGIWCAMGNVVILNNITNDMNLHGGWENTNLFELNYVSVPYSHRSGSCSSCGGESGDQEPGTWFPIWWGAGEKASKWSGASGPQNVFYRNYMIKQEVDGGEYIEYRPYFARDGTLSEVVWQLGWDSQSQAGSWLFLKDVSAAGGIITYTGIAGNTYCRGDVAPRVVGYYFSSASRRPCNPFFPDAIDYPTFTHVLFAYGVLARDGTLSVATEDQSLLRDVAALKSKDSSLKVILAVGGWGLGGDAANMVAIASSASARTKLGTTGAALCSSYGLDGIDLEWAPGISATQWNNIVQAAATGLGSYNLSISTTHAFWSSSGINTVAANLARAVDFASLISHDVPGTTLEYMNALPRMSSTVAAIHKLGFPRSQIMMGVPFYGRSRQLTNTTCTSDGCPIASGLGLTSECIGSSGLGQGTFPYFAINSESVDLGATGKPDDLANSAARFITDSGYVIDYETPASVTEKARAATMLCAAGLAIFAMDQDNRNFDLTGAIWGGGALLPSAAEIVSTLKGEPLTGGGLVSTDFWDQAADQILQQYPNLSMELNYQVMILLAIRALDAVAGSLKEYLKNSALTEDSFQLYKKWETKALNWALANETGRGNDFWQCSYTDSNYAHETCPGGHNTPGADVDNVYWHLTDPGGFSSYLNETIGLDTSELIIGNIYVGRNPSSCFSPLARDISPNATVDIPSIGFADAVPETNATVIENSYIFEDDGTGRVRRPPTANSSALTPRHHINTMPAYDPSDNSEGFSPYDPDEKCRTQWHNVLLINSDTFFPNLKDGIQAFLDQYDEFKLTAVGVTETTTGQTVESLGTVLYMALTTLVSGNDTLASTMTYIEQVKSDKALEDQYNALAKQAREAGIQLIIDIVLTLLSFVPFGGLASIAARTARVLVPVFRSARVTQSLASRLERAYSGAMDAKTIRGVDDLLSPTALAGRGRIGRALDRIQESSFLCEAAEFVGNTLDFAELGEAVITQSVTRRDMGSLGWWIDGPAASGPPDTKGLQTRVAAGDAVGSLVGPAHCIWHSRFTANSLKDPNYMLRCHENSAAYPFKFVAPDGTVKQTTYTDCRPKPANGNKATRVDPEWKLGGAKRKNNPDIPANPAMCTVRTFSTHTSCDHVLEADEILIAIRQPWFAPSNGANKKDLDYNKLSAAEAKTLCSQPEYRQFIRNVVEKLNSASNMRPLYNEPNVYKQTFLNPFNMNGAGPDVIDTKWKMSAQAGNDDRAKYVAIMVNLGLRDWDVGGGSTEKIGRIEEINIRNTRDYGKKLQAANFRTKSAVDRVSIPDTTPVTRKEPPNGDADCPDRKRSRSSVP